MNRSYPVFRIQCAEFTSDKGMLFFYGLAIGITGIIVPLFMHGVEVSLTAAALLTAILLRPMLSGSIAGEREHRTLETLLSSPIHGKSMLWRKFEFCFLFALGYFIITVLCSVFTSYLAGGGAALNPWQWMCIMVVAALNYSAICMGGVYASSTSGDLRAANQRVSLMAYPLSFLFVICLSVIGTVDLLSALIISCICALIYLWVISMFAAKIWRMKQPDFFQPITIQKPERVHQQRISLTLPKSQFGMVLRLEWKMLMTLKRMLLSFGLLCFSPVAMVCLLLYFTGTLDLSYAVLLTVLMIPRVPTNLIAYSIGGEKVYKTGEALLSTPLQIRPVFLAKCMIPVLVTAVMLTLSSVLTLAGVTIAALIMPDLVSLQGYTAAQLILLFPVSLLSSTAMMFIAAILSLRLRTPRQGLYVTSLLSVLFVFPVLAVIYLAPNMLMGSLIYLAVLGIGNLICLKRISDNITRPQLMSRL
ncbi:hypothetical protein MKY96_10150 [Paenibacillus sp. FSL R7-0302]|uniref:hypothetical protein n=1 Tax=Paenibacillus sp. FSL R7-0302 TaxID=2921681 RepID=UPI0030FA2358